MSLKYIQVPNQKSNKSHEPSLLTFKSDHIWSQNITNNHGFIGCLNLFAWTSIVDGSHLDMDRHRWIHSHHLCLSPGASDAPNCRTWKLFFTNSCWFMWKKKHPKPPKPSKTCKVSKDDISSLNQKVSDDSVEAGAVVIPGTCHNWNDSIGLLFATDGAPLKDELAEVSARLSANEKKNISLLRATRKLEKTTLWTNKETNKQNKTRQNKTSRPTSKLDTAIY